MLKAGANPELKNTKFNLTPLEIATNVESSGSYFGLGLNHECVRLLLDAGADASDGSALARACLAKNNLSTVLLLIDAGADVNGIDYSGNHALGNAVVSACEFGGENVKTVKVLIDAGANVGIDYRDMTNFAKRNHCDDVLKILQDANYNFKG